MRYAMLDENVTVSQIAVALYLPQGKGRPIHRDRPTHGIVFNVGCVSIYHFESGEELTVRSGDCVYLPKNSNYTAQRFEISDTKGSGVYAINFLTLDAQESNRPWTMPIKGKDELISLFSKAASAWSKQDVGYHEECYAALYRILRRLKREHSQYAPKEKIAAALAPALRYIDEHYQTESIPISKLASLCGVSEAYLRRQFQKVFAVSPAVYVRNLRIRYAKDLLCNGAYSVTQAATLSGFNDVAYFSREFKKQFGKTPLKYRSNKS